MKAEEILRRGAEVLGEHGWHRGGFMGSFGTVCVMGAMRYALRGTTVYPRLDHLEYDRALAELAQVFKDQYGVIEPQGVSVTSFALSPSESPSDFAIVAEVNDNMAKDPSEIIACMEKAAVNLEGK